MNMSEKTLLVVLVYISGPIMLGNITQYQLNHVIIFYDFSVYFKHIAQSCLHLSFNL